MNEEVKQRNRLARLANVEVYVSGGNGRFYWPFKLQPYDESTPSVRRKSAKYILDSGFASDEEETDTAEPRDNAALSAFTDGEADRQTTDTDSDIESDALDGLSMETNEALIEKARERQPDYVIPDDSVNPQSTLEPATEASRTAIERTAEKVSMLLDEIEEETFPATVIVPLQPPHDFHLSFLHEHYPRQANRGHFALGGMKDFDPEDQVAAIRQFRDVAGNDAYVHGFGMGASRVLIETLREDPHLLDSVDFSTVQQHANNAKFAGPSRKPVHVGRAMGKSSATTTGALMASELCLIARMLAPSLTSEEDIEPSWEKLPHDGPKETPNDQDVNVDAADNQNNLGAFSDS